MSQRIIKFRAWDKDLKSMSKGMTLEEIGKYAIHQRGTVSRYSPRMRISIGKKIEDLIWLQFTGLLDKNGKNPKEELYYRDLMKMGDNIYPIEQSISGAWLVGAETLLNAIEYKGAFKVGNIYESKG